MPKLCFKNIIPLIHHSSDLLKKLGLILRKRRSRRQPTISISDADYADDLAILSDSNDGATNLLHHLEKAAATSNLYFNAKKTELIQCNCNGNTKTTPKLPLESDDSYTYLKSNIESTKNILALEQKEFSSAAVKSVLLYGSPTWTLIKKLENKLDGTYLLRAVLNISWKEHLAKEKLYGNPLQPHK